MKVVIDRGDGFSLSTEAMKRLATAQGVQLYFYTEEGEDIVRVPEEKAAEGKFTYVLTEDVGERLNEDYFFEEYYRFPIFQTWEVKRDNLVLVALVEEMGDAVNAFGSNLKVVEIPDDVEWEIGYEEENYGRAEKEYVYEKHQTWR